MSASAFPQVEGVADPDQSANPMTIPPIIAMAMPTHVRPDVRSFRKIGAARPIHSGVVDTRTTELITVVCASDVIQVAKCSHSNKPLNSSMPSSALLSVA
jgi:hypothetical protein